MVMIFASERAFGCLRDRGEVFTFRKARRKGYGMDWVNRGRGLKKEFDVRIEEVGVYTPDELEFWVGLSGFGGLEEWKEEIKKLNGGKLPESGWLYHVVKNSMLTFRNYKRKNEKEG